MASMERELNRLIKDHDCDCEECHWLQFLETIRDAKPPKHMSIETFPERGNSHSDSYVGKSMRIVLQWDPHPPKKQCRYCNG